MPISCRRRDDAGSALIIAVTIMSIAVGLMLVSVSVAVRTDRSAGVDRQRTSAVAAAESGVDASYATIQNAGLNLPSRWPCDTAVANKTADTGTRPDVVAVSVLITYYEKLGTGELSALNDPSASTTCNYLTPSAGHLPVQARISSTAATTTLAGGTNKGTRRFDSLVNLAPVYGNGFNKAIFGNSDITLKNNHKILGSGAAPDADIYSNANVLCPSGSNQDIKGSIYSQGAVDWAGQCSAAGNVWAKTYVNLGHPQTTVGGNVIASRSSATLSQAAANISGTVTAGTTISWSNCGTKCFANAVTADPPSQPFPILSRSAAALAEWVAQGYVQRTATTNCANTVSEILSWMNQTTKSLYVTTCPVNFSRLNTTQMKSDLVIYGGGFTTSNQVEFASDSAATRKLYWIVPYGTSCPGGNITTDNLFTIGSSVNLFMYTPCDASISNHATDFGQVYGGGKVTIDNNYDMTFKPMPVFGIDSSSLPTLSYNLSVVFKREIR